MGKDNCCERRQSSLFVHLIVCLLGIGSWIAINGLWVELPILVQHLPEGWSLGSYLVIITQVANIGPLVFTVATTLAPGRVQEKPVVYVIVTIGTVSCLLLAFLWDRTSVIAGKEHSTAFLVLQFCLALVDCTSSVVFLPFMSVFKPQYMMTYFVGEGMSGLLPSMVALWQGAGAVRCVNQTNVTIINTTQHTGASFSIHPEYVEPNFPVRDFFLFLFVMMLVCGIAFTCLNHHPACKREMVRTQKVVEDIADHTSDHDPAVQEIVYESRSKGTDNKTTDESGNLTESGSSSSRLLEGEQSKYSSVVDKSSADVSSSAVKISRPSYPSYVYLLVLTVWINALTNGVLPSIQSYSCLPYGTEPYHLAVTLTSISNPLACFIAFFLSTMSNLVITFLTLLGSGVAGYIILLASLSPTPYYVGETTGAALVISSWVMTTLCLTYAKVSIATALRKEGRQGLLWCGATTQIGSAAGAIIMFVLVSIVNSFTAAPMCPV
ncbi:LOW QUALITY PROTEIN: solute carrier family 52, riboflavin transporter, member 3-B-like [Liolophura sinensis]|uniref:LOW QUALITY PROTEIN: solute carrier family 52, riboflavin transporter, member 3-B-like n=1 Tax=Liolophura sinensis TaxID=3198878 RepID=UPI00315955D0